MPSIKVTGMSCGHCKATVEKALSALPGVEKATVDLSAGTVTWTEKPGQSVDLNKIRESISKLGFSAE